MAFPSPCGHETQKRPFTSYLSHRDCGQHGSCPEPNLTALQTRETSARLAHDDRGGGNIEDVDVGLNHDIERAAREQVVVEEVPVAAHAVHTSYEIPEARPARRGRETPQIPGRNTCLLERAHRADAHRRAVEKGAAAIAGRWEATRGTAIAGGPGINGTTELIVQADGRYEWRSTTGVVISGRAAAGSESASGRVTINGATITFRSDAGQAIAHTFLAAAGMPVSAFSIDSDLFTRAGPAPASARFGRDRSVERR